MSFTSLFYKSLVQQFLYLITGVANNVQYTHGPSSRSKTVTSQSVFLQEMHATLGPYFERTCVRTEAAGETRRESTRERESGRAATILLTSSEVLESVDNGSAHLESRSCGRDGLSHDSMRNRDDEHDVSASPSSLMSGLRLQV